jgi:hypothetical protein
LLDAAVLHAGRGLRGGGEEGSAEHGGGEVFQRRAAGERHEGRGLSTTYTKYTKRK